MQLVPAPGPEVITISTQNLAFIVSAVVTLIGAVAAAMTSVIVALRTSRTVEKVARQTTDVAVTAAVIKDTGIKQSAKLVEIKGLVDGRYLQVLEELAEVKQLLAKSSGLAGDQEQADLAQHVADIQAAIVRKAEDRTP